MDGNLRTTPPRPAGTEKKEVYAQFRFSYFIDFSWGLVRELTLLAIQEDVVDNLREISNWTEQYPPHHPTCHWTHNRLRVALQTVLRSNFQDDFKDCLKRRTFTLTNWSEPPGFGPHHPTNHSVLSPSWAKNSPSSRAYSIVHAIYEMHRVGRRIPSEPFLRISSRSHLHSRTPVPSSCGDFLSTKTGWQMSLLYSPVPDGTKLGERNDQTLCLYVLPRNTRTSNEQEPTSQDIASGLIQFLFDRLVVKSYRGGESPPTDSPWQDNDPKHSFWLDIGFPRLGITHGELIISIINWIRDIRPRPNLLPSSNAYMAEYELIPGARTLIKLWMHSLDAEVGPETSTINENMQEVVLTGIAKRPTATYKHPSSTISQQLTKHLGCLDARIANLDVVASASLLLL